MRERWAKGQSELTREMSSWKKRRETEKSATRQRRRIIIATAARLRWNHFLRDSRIIKLCGSPAPVSPFARSPSYSSFSSLTRFLPWTWIHFFPSTPLPLTFRVPSVPWTSLWRRRRSRRLLRSHGSRIYAMTNCPCLLAYLVDRRRQLEVRRIQENCSFDG